MAKLGKWLKSRKGKQVLTIMLFLLVPITLLIVFTYLPFAKMFEFSFYKMKYIGERKYVGLDNYINVFTRADTLKALLNSFYYMGAGVIQLALALYFATILSFKIRGGNFFKATLFFPYLVCGIALGFIFRFFYSRGMVLDTVLMKLGFSQESLPYWLKNNQINNYSIAATSIWRYMGQSMVLFIGAIQSVSPELYEASAIDGANRWTQFKYIILPSIKAILGMNVLLTIKGSFSAFEGAYVITNGTNGTSTLVLMMHQMAHEGGKVGLASAMAIVLLGIIIVATILQKIIYAKFFAERGT